MKKKITGKEVSFWLETSHDTEFSKLEKGLKVDVVILGDGTAGITAATLLKETGHTIAVVETNRIVKELQLEPQLR